MPTKHVAYLDAEHHASPSEGFNALDHGAISQMTNKISHYSIDLEKESSYYFNEADLVLINGNHFKGEKQIVWVHPKKSLEHKLAKLSNVGMVIIEDDSEIPEYLKNHLSEQNYTTTNSNNLTDIVAHIEALLTAHTPKLNGLVLVGGKSTRMQQDKSQIIIRDSKPQFEYLSNLLSQYCHEVFVSVRDKNQMAEYQIPAITDKFVGLGPYGGILSALQYDPNAAWLVVAVDLPFLDDTAIQNLVDKRNLSKMATCYIDRKSEFPEPLITIWEPRSYPVLLNFLSKGYSCPRKALINSDVEILQERDEKILTNVNDQAELAKVKSILNQDGQ